MLQAAMKQSVAVIIFANNRWTNGPSIVGVTRKGNPNDWGLPGGKVDPDEGLKTAAVRELYEETGLVLSENDLQTVFTSEVDSEYECTTYIADFDNTTGIIRPEPGTGSVVSFVGLKELINGSFGEYNDKLFMHLVSGVGFTDDKL